LESFSVVDRVIRWSFENEVKRRQLMPFFASDYTRDVARIDAMNLGTVRERYGMQPGAWITERSRGRHLAELLQEVRLPLS
jgi:hypothetical protein